jgi:hypothetical protein
LLIGHERCLCALIYCVLHLRDLALIVVVLLRPVNFLLRSFLVHLFHSIQSWLRQSWRRLIGHFGQVFFQTQRLLLSSLIRAKDCSILIVWRLCTLFIHRVIVVADRGLYFGYGLRLHVDLLRSSGRLRDMHLLFYTDVLAFHG